MPHQAWGVTVVQEGWRGCFELCLEILLCFFLLLCVFGVALLSPSRQSCI